jgi:Predicted archaeal kinase (sugar kinase superfamily)
MNFKSAAAFSPGHITGFFKICGHTDPHKKGSVGCGIALNRGICSTVTPFEGAGNSLVFLNGKSVEAKTILSAVSALSVIAEEKYGSSFHFKIEENGTLPIGSGFGLSAAGTLGTVFAVNESLRLGLSRDELIEIAHVSEVSNGSGLGDVAGEASGGLVVRENPGGAKFGKFYSVPVPEKDVYCLVLGELSTKEIINDPARIQKINAAGESALHRFLKNQTLDSFMSESLTFSKSIGLLSKTAEKIIDAVDPADGLISQAMLGDTVFAIPSEKEGANAAVLKSMRKFGTVYECKIKAGGPYIC